MAQQRRNQQQRNSGRQNMSSSSESFDTDDDMATSRSQAQGQGRSQQRAQGQGQQGSKDLQTQSSGNEFLDAVTPAFTEARRFIEGSPVRAAAIGAIVGGGLMTLFATEKGRQLVKVAYDYANPMIAKYARDYVSQAAGQIAENSIAQH